MEEVETKMVEAQVQEKDWDTVAIENCDKQAVQDISVTLASGVKAISQVLNPGKIINAPKADSMIDAWEDKMAKLSAEYGEEVSAKMKVAVLYAMLPKDLQERVLDKCAVNWDGAKEAEAAAIWQSRGESQEHCEV